MPESIRMSKKIMLLGDPAVGKTSMIRKFVYDVFDDKYISTLGMKVTTKQMIFEHPINGSKIDLNLMIWDLMGQKEYEIFHKSTFKGASGAIIVCDITRRETLDNVPTWISNLFNITKNIPIVITGNKNDLIAEKAFDLIELEDIARLCKASAFLTSAKTGENVETVFTHLGEEILKLVE